MYTVYAQVFNVHTERHELRPVDEYICLGNALEIAELNSKNAQKFTCVHDKERCKLYEFRKGFAFVRENVPALPTL